MVTHCNEIESKIYTKFRSDVVEFHVTGPEEELTRALHLIREKFKVFVLYNMTVVLIALCMEFYDYSHTACLPVNNRPQHLQRRH